MLIVKWFVIVFVLLVVVAVAAGQLGFLQGTAPTDLGVRDGKLKPPSMTENSVSSQAALYPDHPQRQYAAIAPLALKGDGPATLFWFDPAANAIQVRSASRVGRGDMGVNRKRIEAVRAKLDPAK